jgi:hypothetical protein
VLLWTPFAVEALAATVVSRRWAWWFAVVFIFLPVFGNLGLWYYNYLHRGIEGGWVEPLAITLFFAALAVTLRRLPAAFALPGFAANLMLALAVLCRPNYGAGAVLIIALTGWHLWRSGRLTEAVIAATGFLPILFMAWHNYYFGGVFVPATSTVAHVSTLTAPPEAYVAAGGELLALDLKGDGLRQVLSQWRQWTHDWFLVPFLLALMLALVCGRMSFSARFIGYVALVQHGVLMFWNAKSRFTYLAWGLTVIALLPYLEQGARVLADRWRARRRPA